MGYKLLKPIKTCNRFAHSQYSSTWPLVRFRESPLHRYTRVSSRGMRTTKRDHPQWSLSQYLSLITFPFASGIPSAKMSLENKDLLAKMFSSFVARKTRLSPQHVAPLPPLPLVPPSPRGEKRTRSGKPSSTGSRRSGKSSRVSASTRAPDKHRGTPSSVRPGTSSQASVEAIATDSTSVPKPFHCEKCSSAFRQRSQLVRHFMRVHERQKPFACSHCDKSFASAFDRKRHVEVSCCDCLSLVFCSYVCLCLSE